MLGTSHLLPKPYGASSDRENLPPALLYKFPEVIVSHKFINQLQSALLKELKPNIMKQIHNPATEVPDLTPVEHLSIDTFLTITNASQWTYDDMCKAYLRHHPQDDMLSYYQVKKLIEDLSGITPCALTLVLVSQDHTRIFRIVHTVASIDTNLSMALDLRNSSK